MPLDDTNFPFSLNTISVISVSLSYNPALSRFYPDVTGQLLSYSYENS